MTDVMKGCRTAAAVDLQCTVQYTDESLQAHSYCTRGVAYTFLLTPTPSARRTCRRMSMLIMYRHVYLQKSASVACYICRQNISLSLVMYMAVVRLSKQFNFSLAEVSVFK